MKKILLLTGCIFSITNLSASAFIEEREFTDIKGFKLNQSSGTFVIEASSTPVVKVTVTSDQPECVTLFQKSGNSLSVINKFESGGCACNISVLLPKEIPIVAQVGKVDGEFQGIGGDVELQAGIGQFQFHGTTSNVDVNLGKGSLFFKPVLSNTTQNFKVAVGIASSVNFELPGGTTYNHKVNGLRIKRTVNVPLQKLNPNYFLKMDGTFSSLKVSYLEPHL